MTISHSDILFTVTQKGKDLLTYLNHSYNIKRRNRANIVWICTHKGCNSQIISSLDYHHKSAIFNSKYQHNHTLGANNATRRIYFEAMKEHMRITEQSPRQVVHKILRGAPQNVIEAVGDFQVLYRTLTNIREKAINPKPYLYINIRLSEIFTKNTPQHSILRIRYG